MKKPKYSRKDTFRRTIGDKPVQVQVRSNSVQVQVRHGILFLFSKAEIFLFLIGKKEKNNRGR